MISKKTSLHALLATSLLAASACDSKLDDKPTAKVNEPAKTGEPDAKPEAAKPNGEARTLTLIADKSSIEFVGAKVTGDHRGSFGAPSGTVQIAGDEVKALSVTVDTTKLKIEPEKLQGHLASPDFFDVAKFPTSSFKLTSMAAKAAGDTTHEVTGDLVLRGVTKSITFPAKINITDSGADATASFKIKRQDFGIVYTGMADDLIKDEVLLDLNLAFGA